MKHNYDYIIYIKEIDLKSEFDYYSTKGILVGLLNECVNQFVI